MPSVNQTLLNIDQTFRKINFLWDNISEVAAQSAQFEAKKLKADFQDNVDKLKKQMADAEKEIENSIKKADDYLENLTPEKARNDLKKIGKEVDKDISDFSNRIDNTLKSQKAKSDLSELNSQGRMAIFDASQKLKASLASLNESLKHVGEAMNEQIDEWSKESKANS